MLCSGGDFFSSLDAPGSKTLFSYSLTKWQFNRTKEKGTSLFLSRRKTAWWLISATGVVAQVQTQTGLLGPGMRAHSRCLLHFMLVMLLCPQLCAAALLLGSRQMGTECMCVCVASLQNLAVWLQMTVKACSCGSWSFALNDRGGLAGLHGQNSLAEKPNTQLRLGSHQISVTSSREKSCSPACCACSHGQVSVPKNTEASWVGAFTRKQMAGGEQCQNSLTPWSGVFLGLIWIATRRVVPPAAYLLI